MDRFQAEASRRNKALRPLRPLRKPLGPAESLAGQLTPRATQLGTPETGPQRRSNLQTPLIVNEKVKAKTKTKTKPKPKPRPRPKPKPTGY